MEESGPVRPGMIVWRGWRHWGIGFVDSIGVAHESGGAWLVPVRFTAGDYGIVHAVPRLKPNGIETYVLHAMNPDHGECERMLGATTAMPDIISFSGDGCRLVINEGGVDFEISASFGSSGATFAQPVFLPT